MATEASPTVVSVRDVCVRFNDIEVLNNASLSIGQTDKIGLVGRNGSGKSTFLRIAAGLRAPDTGEISVRKDIRLQYVPQDYRPDPEATVESELRSGCRELEGLLRDFETLPGDDPRHAEIETRIHALDGWNLDTRIATARDKLRLPGPDAPMGRLSGGERRRVSLARAIVAQPNFLILDEPTNHLDPDAIEWVADYLKSFAGAVLLVTHDRYFLQEITRVIVELFDGAFERYEGTYGDYLEQKAERMAIAERVEENRQRFLKREIEWIRRGPKARTTKSKARIERYETAANQDGPTRELTMDMVIPPPPPLGNRVVELVDVNLAYGDKRVLQDFSFKFEKGMRVGVCGRNGLGKSSLLKVVIGATQPDSGERRAGELTEINYVDQDRLQLNDENNLLQELAAGSEFIQFGGQKLSVRAYLKRFLFADSRLVSPIKILSGGERSRLILAKILIRGGNFLVLDEPTNDLDLQTLQVLEDALIDFDGVCLIVSHDRYFLNRVCTHVLGFEDVGTIRVTVGDYDAYVDQRRRQTAAQRTPQKSTETAPSKADNGTTEKPPARKLKYMEQRELESMEERIQEAEGKVDAIESQIADPANSSDAAKLSELTEELATAEAEVAQLYARWEELESMQRGDA